MTTEAIPTALTEGERSFVEKVAEYYYVNDGMPHDRGRVVGWLMICDPAEQTAEQIAKALGVNARRWTGSWTSSPPRTTR